MYLFNIIDVCDSNQQTNKQRDFFASVLVWFVSFQIYDSTVWWQWRNAKSKQNPNNAQSSWRWWGGVLMIATPCRTVLCIDTKLKTSPRRRVVVQWLVGLGWLGLGERRRVAVTTTTNYLWRGSVIWYSCRKRGKQEEEDETNSSRTCNQLSRTTVDCGCLLLTTTTTRRLTTTSSNVGGAVDGGWRRRRRRRWRWWCCNRLYHDNPFRQMEWKETIPNLSHSCRAKFRLDEDLVYHDRVLLIPNFSQHNAVRHPKKKE